MRPLKLLFISKLLALVIVALVSAGSIAQGRNLIVALKVEPTSLDPHFQNLTSNIQIAQTIFSPLVCRDSSMMLQPCLAESWSVDGNEWTFRLRENATFSDGSPVSAEDVVFSLKRLALLPNNPSPLTIYLQMIDRVEAVDAKTVRIVTLQPYPFIPENMIGVPIMSAQAASGPVPEGKTTVQLNRGDGLVGSGPYKFVSWQRGAELVLERNPYYWGPAPEWDRVIYRPIANAAIRVAALQAGDVDIIESPSVESIQRLWENPMLKVVVQGPSNRLIFVGLDVWRVNTPGISRTHNGKNPLMDQRVREAMSLAIDRNAIKDRIMNGMATPAAQLMIFPESDPDTRVQRAAKPDIIRAKALLAEAGYPNGFSLVLGVPSGRYMNDVGVAQVLASMWTRVGIKVDLSVSAPPVFFSKLKNLD
ncbi:MAG: ABC transporter substrate-binding protein, partial [Shewanella sp.]